MAQAQPNGLIGDPRKPGEGGRYTFGHGLGMLFLCWSDWVPQKTDYDAYVYFDANLTQPDSASVRDQSVPGVDPIEYPTCSHPGQVEYLVIQKFANNGSSPVGDVLEFMTNGTGLEYWQNPYSADAPAVDVAPADTHPARRHREPAEADRGTGLPGRVALVPVR